MLLQYGEAPDNVVAGMAFTTAINEVGAWIQRRRLVKGVSLETLSKLSGIPHDRLVEYEDGLAVPSYAEMQSIASATGRHFQPRVVLEIS